MNCWKRWVLGTLVVATAALGTGCGSDSGDGRNGWLSSEIVGGFPRSSGGGPGTGEPVPFRPGTNYTLSISPSPLYLYRGQEQPLTIQGVNPDGSTFPVTPGPGVSVSITSSAPTLANVSSSAVVTPLSRGDGTLNVAVTTPDGTVNQPVPFSVRRRMFVTHFGDDTLRVFDAATYAPVKTIDLGGHPLAMTVHPPTDKLWVGVGDGQGINVFSLANLNLEPTEISGPEPLYGYTRALFNPFNNTMMWIHHTLSGTAGTLQGYDAASLSPMSGSPQSIHQVRGLALDDTGSFLLNLTIDFLADTGVQVRDADTLASLDFVSTWETPSDFGFPTDLVYDSVNQCLYVATYNAVNPPYLSKILTINMSGPRGISAATPLPTPRTGSMAIFGGRVFLSHFGSSSVSVLRTTSANTPLTFERTLTAGMNPANITIDSSLNRLVVSGEGTDSLYVFDLTTLDPIPGSPFPTGDGPSACVFEP